MNKNTCIKENIRNNQIEIYLYALELLEQYKENIYIINTNGRYIAIKSTEYIEKNLTDTIIDTIIYKSQNSSKAYLKRIK